MKVNDFRVHRNCLLFFIYSVFLSAYISSWAPMLGGYPFGAIIRELAIVLFIVTFCLSIIKSKKALFSREFVVYVILISITLFLFYATETKFSQYLVGVNSFVVFPAVFSLVLLWLMSLDKVDRSVFLWSLSIHLPRLLVFFATVGVLDVFLAGGLVTALGYDPNYGGEDFVLITRYYDRVRAHAGIGDALAFGYLMAISSAYFLYELRYRYNYFFNLYGLSICSLACCLSLTRGAIFSLGLVYMIRFLSLRGVFLLAVIGGGVFFAVSQTEYMDVYVGRFTDSDDGSARSSELRLIMALSSMAFLAEHPLGIGIGTQGAGNLLGKFDLRLNTDSYLFHIFLELGWVGGVLFILFISNQLYRFFRMSGDFRLNLSVLAAFLVTSLLSSAIAFATFCVPFWILLLIMSRRRSDNW